MYPRCTRAVLERDGAMSRHCLGRCGRLIDTGSYCPTCRPRNGSTREWRKLREIVLQREDHRCQIRGPGCTGTASHVDHIVPVARGGTDEAGNCRAACATCNEKRGARE